MDINKDLLLNCYNEFKSKQPIYAKMYKYYCGGSDAIDNYSNVEYQESHKNNINFIKKMIKEEVSYSVGNRINYVSKENEDITKDIDYYLYHWKKNHDSELLKNMLIFSKTYELYYISNVDLTFNSLILNPLNGYAYTDEFENVIFFMHIFKLKFHDNIYIDLYTDNEIIHLNEEFKEIKERDIHIFNRVPIATGIISTEEEKDTLYADLRDIQDALSIITSDGVNEITNTRQAILKGKGMEITEELAKKLKKYRFADMSEKGDLEWLIKNLNPEYQKLMMDKLEDYIYKLSFHINSQEKMQSNTSSLALRTRLINLEMKVKLNNLALTNLILNRIKFLFIYLKVKENKDYDYRDVTIKFNSIIPQDDLIMSQIVSQLNDKLSLKTGLQQLSFIDNSDSEIKQIRKEREEEFVNLDNVHTGDINERTE